VFANYIHRLMENDMEDCILIIIDGVPYYIYDADIY
jgi:hypothetical protein